MRIDDAQLYVGRRRTRTRATAILDERCSMPMCSRETGTAHTYILEDIIIRCVHRNKDVGGLTGVGSTEWPHARDGIR